MLLHEHADALARLYAGMQLHQCTSMLLDKFYAGVG
jgi:hypothetical protein